MLLQIFNITFISFNEEMKTGKETGVSLIDF